MPPSGSCVEGTLVIAWSLPRSSRLQTVSEPGVFAPSGTAPAVVKKLESELRRAITSAEVVPKLRALAVNPGGGPADEFTRMIDAEITSYGVIVKAANLKFAD
jgi:tripartite-type tricarboxylate transporter receptor subunit TctC